MHRGALLVDELLGEGVGRGIDRDGERAGLGILRLRARVLDLQKYLERFALC